MQERPYQTRSIESLREAVRQKQKPVLNLPRNDRTSYERVRELFSYDPDTGFLSWLKTGEGKDGKKRGCHRRKVGEPVGYLNKKGYLLVTIDGQEHSIHRLIWLWVTRGWPDRQIDHIDTNKRNNRWDNLRLATNTQNQANTGLRKTNTSGYKGVCWNNWKKLWRAAIHVGGRRGEKRVIGYYNCPTAAYFAYFREAKKIHGEFARRP